MNEKEVFDTYGRWEEEIKTGQSCNLAIEQLDRPVLIGCITIRFPRHPQQADIGYWLADRYTDYRVF